MRPGSEQARGASNSKRHFANPHLEVLAVKPGALAGSTALARARSGGSFDGRTNRSGSTPVAASGIVTGPGRSSTCCC